MENEHEYISYLNLEALIKDTRKQEKQRRRHQRAEKVKAWFSRNMGTILTVAPIAVGTVTGIVKEANRRSALNKEQQLKDLYCYDRSLGHYWQLKRKLSNSDWVKINDRRNSGESLADILADMNVLKR